MLLKVPSTVDPDHLSFFRRAAEDAYPLCASVYSSGAGKGPCVLVAVPVHSAHGRLGP